jgi:hypothetical protein
MKKALLAVMAIALVLGFAGCSLFGGGKSPYYPLKEGNKWEYSGWSVSEMIFTSDLIPDTYDSTATSSTTEVVGETELTGDEAIKVWEVKTTSGDVTTTDYVDVDKDWVYFYDELSDSDAWYKWPNEPVKGDKWDVVFAIDSTTSVKISYEVVEEGVTAFGDYTDCLKISVSSDAINVADYETYENYIYLAKNVGQVMSTTKSVMITVVGTDTTTYRLQGESKLDKFTEG